MISKKRLLKDCLKFCAWEKISLEQLCRRAAQDSRIAERLEQGGTITLEKMDMLYAYMSERLPIIINPMLGESNGKSKESCR